MVQIQSFHPDGGLILNPEGNRYLTSPRYSLSICAGGRVGRGGYNRGTPVNGIANSLLIAAVRLNLYCLLDMVLNKAGFQIGNHPGVF